MGIYLNSDESGNSILISYTYFLSFFSAWLYICQHILQRAHCTLSSAWEVVSLSPPSRCSPRSTTARKWFAASMCLPTFYLSLFVMYLSLLSTTSSTSLSSFVRLFVLLIQFSFYVPSLRILCSRVSAISFLIACTRTYLCAGAMPDCTPVPRTAGRRSAVTPATCAPRRS